MVCFRPYFQSCFFNLSAIGFTSPLRLSLRLTKRLPAHPDRPAVLLVVVRVLTVLLVLTVMSTGRRTVRPLESSGRNSLVSVGVPHGSKLVRL